jgi:hypothetical protein
MAYNLPKTLKGQQLLKHLNLFATRGNYKTGMWFTKEARSLPEEIHKFLMPHGDDVSEDEFIKAAESHIAKHGFRIKPVWVDTIYKYHGKQEK